MSGFPYDRDTPTEARETLLQRVPESFFDSADYAIAKTLGLYCGRCERVTTPYASEDREWPCCNGCWKGYPV